MIATSLPRSSCTFCTGILYTSVGRIYQADMGILTDDMKRIVREHRFGYIATVCPDGTPNLSPKRTTAVYDDDHLVFADIRSPQSVRNLERKPTVEINVGVPLVCQMYPDAVVVSKILIRVDGVLPVLSPAYDCRGNPSCRTCRSITAMAVSSALRDRVSDYSCPQPLFPYPRTWASAPPAHCASL
jgi:Pyridoxamine 5'-phosphate oxidase